MLLPLRFEHKRHDARKAGKARNTTRDRRDLEGKGLDKLLDSDPLMTFNLSIERSLEKRCVKDGLLLLQHEEKKKNR